MLVATLIVIILFLVYLVAYFKDTAEETAADISRYWKVRYDGMKSAYDERSSRLRNMEGLEKAAREKANVRSREVEELAECLEEVRDALEVARCKIIENDHLIDYFGENK